MTVQWYKPIDKNICIIILNWQNWQDTVHCLASLQILPAINNISVIVCDNGSTNQAQQHIVAWARQYYTHQEIQIFNTPPTERQTFLSPFIFIQIGENLGFAGGNNVGIRFALASRQCDYVWLLNSDTIVDVHALAALYGFAQAYPKVALIGSTIAYYDRPNVTQCAGGCRYNPLLTKVENVLEGELITHLRQFDQVNLDYICGASLFIRVSAIRTVGLLNEEYFLFYEELDYTQRLKKRGYRIAWCQPSLVFHKGSATIKHLHEQARQRLQLTNYYENLNTLKYTSHFHPYFLPIAFISRFVLKSLFLILRRQFFLFSPLLKAYRDFFQHIFFKRRQSRKKE